jgi:RNA polymerase sigma-70 factor (sigma-E family)
MKALEDAEFRGFVTSRGHALLRTAYLLTGDQQLAEDLVQTSLEKTVRHWGSIRASAAIESYVRQTMYRAQVSAWRRRRLRETTLGSVPEPRGASGDSSEDTLEVRLVMRDALMDLSRRQRTVVVLRYFDDLTEQQVADALGISVGTVKSQAHKALARLRETCRDLAPTSRGGSR